MSFFSTAHAADATHAAAPHAGQSMSSMLIFIAIMFGAIYFLIIRPQTKRASKQKEMQDSIRMGDEVMTIGGILGQVSKLRGENIVLRICENTELTLKRSAAAQILPQKTSEASPSDTDEHTDAAS